MIKNFRKSIFFKILIFINITVHSQSIKVSGFITDKNSGESLIGTNILVYRDSINTKLPPVSGSSTNSFGFYVVTGLSPAKYVFVFRYTGYKTFIRVIDLTGGISKTNQNIYLVQESIKLDEILVEGKKVDKEAYSEIEVSPEILNKLPSFSGEVDLFRTLQLLPGINKGSELSNGLYIRGGSPDQTLVLVDGSIVYNPSHLGNIASTFNSNAIREVTLIKGAIPAEYGGRMGGILDVKLRSGTKEREKQTIGIGFINSFFSFEGPVKESSSYMIAGRGMYYDAIQKNVNKKSLTPLYRFYDANAKITHNFSESSILSLSAIYSSDRLYNPSADNIAYDIDWRNLNLILNWYKINSNSLFLNSILSFINYEFSSKIGITNSTTSSSSYYSNPNLKTIVFRQSAEYKWENNQVLKSGLEISSHSYDLKYNDHYNPVVENDPNAVFSLRSIEGSVFIQNESEFWESLKTNLGGRVNYFLERNLFSFEPRISVSYEAFDNFFIKSGYAVTNQNVHLILRNDISLPTDLWYPATKKIKPGNSKQFDLSLNSYFDNETYEASIEGYYRSMHNLYEFKSSPDINSFENGIEDQFVTGRGEAYGIELFVQKRSGFFTGWIGYTLSWSKRKFDDINSGQSFYPKYDRRHDLSAAATFDIMTDLSLGATFTYATGLRYTLPPTQFQFYPIGLNGNPDIYLNYGELNGSKFPPYHKLDLSLTYKTLFDTKELKLFANVYNVYNHNNAYAQYVVDVVDSNGNTKTQLKRISLFPFIPSVGVSLTF
jgi:outer membrane cobalamin receptor